MSSMLLPLGSALILAGILVYFGIHVIGRKVIFVDLALAQIAALGSAFGVLMGFEAQHDAGMLYAYSLAFTLVAALIFSITKMRSESIPHEAIIGITYAVAVAATILVLSKSGIGPQEFERMMKGDILWVTFEKFKVTCAVYAAVAIFHWICRRQFMAISFAIGEPPARPKLWDFLFYASFGFVVTSSVSIAGIFLVFSYLIVPAVGALLFAQRLRTRLLIGWVGGAVASFGGVIGSFQTGLPTSPLIVTILAGLLVLAAVVRYVVAHPAPLRAVGNVLLFTLFFTCFALGLFATRKGEDDPFEHSTHLAHSRDEAERKMALMIWEGMPERRGEWIERAKAFLKDSSKEVRLKAVDLLVATGDESTAGALVEAIGDAESDVRSAVAKGMRRFHAPKVVERLLQAATAEEETDIRLEIYESVVELGEKRGIDKMVDIVLDREGPSVWRQEAYERLKAHVAFEFNLESVGKFAEWWRANRDRLVWNPKPDRLRFELP